MFLSNQKITAGLCALIGCWAVLATTATAVAEDEPITIVTTCGMVTDIVRQVGGSHVKVTGLMGEGVDPHLYKPTAGDARAIVGADMIFYSGLMLEGRMADTFMKAARLGKTVYPVTELIDASYLLEPAEFAGHWDPHVWMDVSAWSCAVDAVATALCDQDDANCNEYRERAAAYKKRLAALDVYVKKAMETIPEDRRVLITAHDAFNYFGRAYGLEVIGVQGLSTESEAGIEDINRLVDMIVTRKINALFVESSVSDRNVQALVEGAASRGHTVRIGGRLFSDAMGATGTYEGTYIGMIDHNATTIATALGGEVPEGGLGGDLAHVEE